MKKFKKITANSFEIPYHLEEGDYRIRVRSFNAAGDTWITPPKHFSVYVPHLHISNLSHIELSNKEVELNWEPGTGSVYYKVYYSCFRRRRVSNNERYIHSSWI